MILELKRRKGGPPPSRLSFLSFLRSTLKRRSNSTGVMYSISSGGEELFCVLGISVNL